MTKNNKDKNRSWRLASDLGATQRRGNGRALLVASALTAVGFVGACINVVGNPKGCRYDDSRTCMDPTAQDGGSDGGSDEGGECYCNPGTVHDGGTQP